MRRNAFEISLSNFAKDHTDIVADMAGKWFEILLTQKAVSLRHYKEIAHLRQVRLAASNKKLKSRCWKCKGVFKQVGAKIRFLRSQSSQKNITTKKPKSAYPNPKARCGRSTKITFFHDKHRWLVRFLAAPTSDHKW